MSSREHDRGLGEDLDRKEGNKPSADKALDGPGASSSGADEKPGETTSSSYDGPTDSASFVIRKIRSREETAWVFDRKAYERDMKLLKFQARLRSYAALALVVFAACLVAYIVLERVDRSGQVGTSTPSASSSVAKSGPKKWQPEPQEILKARETIDRAVRGELDEASIKQFRHIPEYNRCRQCFSECEQSAVGNTEVLLQDCRRNCLRTCSDTARQLMDR